MKRTLISAASIMLLAGAAQAAPLTATQAAAAQYKLYIAGSSAVKNLIEGMVSQNCDSSGMSIWRSKKGQAWAGSSSADSSDGSSHNIYACTLASGNDFGLAAGSTVLVVKRDAGGSAQGVFPIAKNLAQLMMNIATCDANANTVTPASGPAYGVCTGEVSVKADMGISDVEPTIFNASFNKASAFAAYSVANSDFLAAPTVFAQAVMGLVVNGKLYSDLQADQGLTASNGVPSIAAPSFFSMMNSNYDTSQAWNPLFSSPTSAAATLINTHVNVAFRGVGSGTRTSAGLYFNNYPTGKVANDFAGQTSPTTFSNAADGGISILNASSSGNVISAVDGCGAATYCMGILGLEQNLSGKDVKFVKVDGNSPANARLGQYGVVYESTYQVAKTGNQNGAAGQSFANLFGTAMAQPKNIYAAFNGNGYLALGQNCPAAGFTGWVNPPESVVCSRVTRNGNSFNPLLISY